MQADDKRRNLINIAAALIFVTFLGILLALRYDFYYDLNDDMLMKDIISGIHTGIPDGHNIQMLFPLGWFLSLFYFVIRQVTWYGLFFIVCHFGCLFLLVQRSFGYFDRIWSKALALLVEGVFICAFLLYELVFIQYTVTAAVLGATAAFLLYTTDRELPWRTFVQKNIISIILVILAYQVRTEMLLLIFPLICVAGFCKWSREDTIFSAENIKKYSIIIGSALLGMLISFGADRIAYGDAEWKSFNSFFDSRTDIYDFYGIPPFEENRAFYESIGMQKSEQFLLENYNFGLSEDINEQTLEQVAEYAKQNQTAAASLSERLKRSIREYASMVLLKQEVIPWNQLVLLLYAFLIIAAVMHRNKSFLWKLPMLFGVRSLLWLYLLYGGRIKPRVSHSLYWMECILLLVFLLELYAEGKRSGKLSAVKRGIYCAGAAALLVFSGSVLLTGVREVEDKFSEREATNTRYEALQAYCRENKENFYFLDIYSTVAYSEKLFDFDDHMIRNYDYLGGWACKSPVDLQKIEAFGIGSIEGAVLQNGNKYVIAETDRSVDWLEQYLRDEGNDVTVRQSDVIIDNGTEVFCVYQVINGG